MDSKKIWKRKKKSGTYRRKIKKYKNLIKEMTLRANELEPEVMPVARFDATLGNSVLSAENDLDLI